MKTINTTCSHPPLLTLRAIDQQRITLTKTTYTTAVQDGNQASVNSNDKPLASHLL